MTPREQRLAILLGAIVLPALLLVLGYLFFYEPYLETVETAERIENANSDLEARLAAANKNMPRFRDTLKRSLPADPDVARQEYDAAINRILRDAKVPSAIFSVKPKAVDGKAAPELSPKKPAYSRISLEISMKPVDLTTLIEVLKRYYTLNLLQQITKFTVKKVDIPGGGYRRFGSTVADRADLDVTMVTEAIILDGAEPRKSLLPVPNAAGAVAGAPGYIALNNSPDVARGLTPLQLARIMAFPERDYSLMLVKDVFHGPPPPPLAIQPIKDKEPDPPPPPKEDTSPFIRLTGIGRRDDGTGSAFIEDTASKQEYVIEITRKGNVLIANVVKYYFTIKGVRKSYAPEPELDISEASSGTARKFRVIGFDEDVLILGSKDETKPVAKKTTGFGPGSFGPPPTSSSFKSSPAAAAAGVAALSGPSEKIFAWKHGEPLSKVKELTRDDAAKAVKRATGQVVQFELAPPPVNANTSATVGPKSLESEDEK